MLTTYVQEQYIWILIVGFLLSFILVFSVGANSVPNAFGTSIGATVLTHFQAVILAGIFMTLGAVIIGPAVADTIENSIADISLYQSSLEQLMLGQLSVILACALWKIIATTLKLPVAITHSIVGAVVGFHVTAIGIEGIYWTTLIFLAISWVTSPLLSGVIAIILYKIVLKTIVEKENPLESGAKTLPLWFGVVVSINVLSVLLQLESLFGEFYMAWYLIIAISLGGGILTAILVWFCIVPRLKKNNGAENKAISSDKIETSAAGSNENATYENIKQASDLNVHQSEKGSENAPLLSESDQLELNDTERLHENLDVAKLCSPLLVVSVIFAAYAYGSILVSTGVAPLITIWNVYETGRVEKAVENPFWMFLYGSCALTLGFAIVGGRVTQTVGEGITFLSSSRAFPIELGATVVLLVASNFGIPVSTAHCKIGAITAVGYYSDGGVDFRLVSKILIAWVVTLPATTGLSAGLFALFRVAYQYSNEENAFTSNSTSLLHAII
ncbi:Sodium-dependent phosphate transporter 1-B [Holothuria leucospilota]|uniref:Phosphate transporter n=1 Tax=Holothuria leucospilota TaxID=206669 RepID=A0A9Q0YIF7_HOLLE|nr:Sodium-dependent phosphate transporter 1-B [Holothuria leucospilota]